LRGGDAGRRQDDDECREHAFHKVLIRRAD
jgi:hypothetical protein